MSLLRRFAAFLVVIAVVAGGLIWLRADLASSGSPGQSSGVVATAAATSSVASSGAVATPAATQEALPPPSPSTQTTLQPPSPTPIPVPTGYSVTIAAGLHPQWTAEAAAATVIARILHTEQVTGRVLAEPRVLSVEAMAGKDVPDSASGPFPDHGVCWVVLAQGTFWSSYAPGTAGLYASEAWLVYDDQGNEIGGSFVSGTPTP